MLKIIHQLLNGVFHDKQNINVMDEEKLNEFILFIKTSVDKHRSKDSDTNYLGHGVSTRIGHGTDYSESRPYSAGDDIRRINWKQTARSQQMMTSQFYFEHENTDCIILDATDSMFYGTRNQAKITLALKQLIIKVIHSLNAHHQVRLIICKKELISFPSLRQENEAINVFRLIAKYSCSHDFPTDKRKNGNISNVHINEALEFILATKSTFSSLHIISDFIDINKQSVELLQQIDNAGHTLFTIINDPNDINPAPVIPLAYTNTDSTFELKVTDVNQHKSLIRSVNKHHKTIESLLHRTSASIVHCLTTDNDDVLINHKY